MRQSKARKERRTRKEYYQFLLRNWQYEKPPWWRFRARRRWKADKPKYIRR